jgi:hypothetical protein
LIEASVTMTFDLSNLEQRQKPWMHVRDVLTIPEVPAVSFLVQDCGVVDRMIIDLESRQEKNPDGTVIFKDHVEAIALAHLWVMGFFSIFQIVCSKGYERVAEIKIGADLKTLKNRVRWVRTAFSQLQKPGKGSYVIPSFSSLGGTRGIVYAVYGDDGKDVNITRRDLADEFLRMMEQLPPSARFREMIAAALGTDPAAKPAN